MKRPGDVLWLFDAPVFFVTQAHRKTLPRLDNPEQGAGGNMRLSKSRAAGLIPIFLLCACFADAQQASQVQPRITGPIDPARRITLAGNTHPLARPEFDRGAAPDQQALERMLLVLKRAPEQEAGLRELLDEQQAKSSSNFHRWLTPEEFGSRFGPADADVQVLTAWLESRGFQVNRVAAGRAVIEFSGAASQMHDTFHTEIHRYAVNGKEYWANASDPQIPEALAPVVAGFASLNNFPRRSFTHRVGTFRRFKTGKTEPLYTFSDLNGTFYALGPTDFDTIYNVLPLWKAGITGSGQTIAIVSDSNINVQDATNFRSLFGLPANNPQVILDGPDPGITGSETEADTDTQWAGAVAENATIKLVVSEDTETTAGVDLSGLYIIDNNIAPVMSVSYGECESDLGASGNAFYNSVWGQGAAEGITIIVAAGDSGSAACDGDLNEDAAQYGLAVSGQASTPFNVAMGGTDFNDSTDASTYWSSTNTAGTEASALSYIPETTWNNSCAQQGLSACYVNSVPTSGIDLQGGGGGPSTCATMPCAGYPKPSWQVGAGVPDDHVRDLPDLAMFAGNGANGSFYVVCEADANGTSSTSCDLNTPYTDFQGLGGTSVPTPAFAGIMALVNQKTGERQGNANYVLYKLAAQSGASCTSNSSAVGNQACIFYDVTTGNNSVACVAGSEDCDSGTTDYGAVVTSGSSTTLAWTTTPGYDLATGLGSVNATNLVNNWHSVTFTPSTTTLSLSPTTITHGQPVQFTIKVTGGAGTAAGSVTLEGAPGNSTYGIANFALSGGAATGSTDQLPGGTYTVTARYSGSGTYGASTSTPPVSVTVGKESSMTTVALVTMNANGTVTSSTATSAPYGSFYVLRSNVTNAAGQSCASAAVGCPTGQVTLSANGQPLPNQGSSSPGTYALNSQGYLEDAFIQFPGGSYSVVGSYSGDNSFLPSSATVPMTISKAATDTYAPSTLNGDGTVSYGSSIKLVVDVTTQSSGVAPTGTVQFLNGAKPVSGTVSYTGYSAATSSTGYALLQATLTTTPSANEGLNISYGGDSNYAASSGSFIIYVNPGIVVSAEPTSLSIAAPGGTASSTVSMNFGGGTFSGPITFNCNIPYNMLATTCSFSPSSLSAAGNTTVTITTTGGSSAPPLPRIPPAGTILLGAVLLGFLALARRRRWNPAAALLLCTLAAAIVVACGGGSSSSSSGTTVTTTPAGTYTVGVVASGTSAGNTVSSTANLTVTVQ